MQQHKVICDQAGCQKGSRRWGRLYQELTWEHSPAMQKYAEVAALRVFAGRGVSHSQGGQPTKDCAVSLLVGGAIEAKDGLSFRQRQTTSQEIALSALQGCIVLVRAIAQVSAGHQEQLIGLQNDSTKV